jgi:para-nitrobenzyl esterase
MKGPVVMTAAGALRGASKDGVHSFKGVPYGGSTGGRRRFRPPPAPEPWTGVREARSVGPACPQPTLTAGGSPVGRDVLELFSSSGLGYVEAYGEDCLTLNVWTPAVDGGRRPVLVWFHGGAWTLGSGNLPAYDGTRLAARGDAVVVTVNHRLGALGYLWLGERGGEEHAASGAVGALDMVAALEWVRDHIPTFGGDPGNVTIFGESGGGAKVSALLAMPAAGGLFHRAIIQSGPMLRGVTPERAARTTAAIMERLGVSRMSDLEAVPAERLVAAQTDVLGGPLGGFGAGHSLGPVVDGAGGPLPVHPFDPVAAPTAAAVPLVIGTTRDEMTLFTAFMPGFDHLAESDLPAAAAFALRGVEADTGRLMAAYRRTRPGASPGQRLLAAMTDRFRVGSIRLAERKAAGGPAPVRMYRLDFTTPVLGGRLGAPHALDIPLVFDNLEASALHGGRPEAQALADRMSEAWLAFARTGDPNHPGLPEWPVYETGRRATMLFDTGCRVVDDPDGAERAAWDGLLGGL